MISGLQKTEIAHLTKMKETCMLSAAAPTLTGAATGELHQGIVVEAGKRGLRKKNELSPPFFRQYPCLPSAPGSIWFKSRSWLFMLVQLSPM